MYGRGARALAREIGKAGVDITVGETEQIIQAFADSYPDAWAWLQKNQESAVINEWAETPFGRRRWFTGVSNLSASQQSAARRQASNSPIQGTVADLLSLAGVTLYRAKYRVLATKHLRFKVVLPVHDAFIVEIHKDDLGQVIKLLELALTKLAIIPGTGRHLGCDVEIFKRWGDEIKPSEIPELAASS